jgi:hypothetical protein
MKAKRNNKPVKKPKNKSIKVRSGKQEELSDAAKSFRPFSKLQQIGNKK